VRPQVDPGQPDVAGEGVEVLAGGEGPAVEQVQDDVTEVRIPEDRERPFRPIVNGDSGDREQPFRAS
jgi:hypothetical protein